MGGIKYDQGKPPLEMLPYEALVEIARVFDFGAKKYSRDNWKDGINYSRVIGAAMRHLGRYNNGEDLDPETGISHLAHASCNLMFLIWYTQNRPEYDDRYKK